MIILRYDFLIRSDAACNSRFSRGSVETGAASLIEWITCCGNYKHWTGIYIRHGVEKCTVLMAPSEAWSNKISFVYKTYFIKVSALLHSLKPFHQSSKRAARGQVWWFQNILAVRKQRNLSGVKIVALKSHFPLNGKLSCCAGNRSDKLKQLQLSREWL